jgi:hypothetical protein
MIRRRLALALCSTHLTAQQPATVPPIRRWLDVQSLTLYTRYRFTETNQGKTTADQLQYKEQVQARLKLDEAARYTIAVGFFSGSSFVGTWDNLGIGNGTSFDGSNHYIKQLYLAAIPIAGVELQYGGLYLNRGEADEWVTYDTDGYIVGERVSVHRPRELHLDEVTVTRAAIGPMHTPNLFDRLDGLRHPNYTQLLARTRVSKLVGGSFEYSRQIGADYLRGALTLHLPSESPIDAIRAEGYHRFNQHAASGIGLSVERSLSRRLRVQGGFVNVDQFYGGWNADRMLSGRRLFASASIPIRGPVSASLYWTHTVDTPYAVPIGQRFDAVIGYNLLDTLRRAGIF